MANQPGQVTVVTQTKNMGVAIILTVLFGPLGMFYSTIVGAVVMFILSAIVGLLTVGLGLIVMWPICVIWAAIATSNYNKKLMSTQQP
jgi:hypothetical protein